MEIKVYFAKTLDKLVETLAHKSKYQTIRYSSRLVVWRQMSLFARSITSLADNGPIQAMLNRSLTKQSQSTRKFCCCSQIKNR